MTPYVLVGAGGLGRKLAAYVHPVAMVDRDPVHAAGKWVWNVPVLTLDEALLAHPDATYCVTIWGAGSTHRIADTEAELRRRGVTLLASFATLLRLHNLSHYCIGPVATVENNALSIARAANLWADDASRREFLAQVHTRLTGYVSLCGEPIPGPQYLAPNLFRLRDDEIVLDGGAYNGDTLRAWLKERGPDSFAKWLACEPHPDNAAAFRGNLHKIFHGVWSTVELYEVALGAAAGMTRMTFDGGVAARASTDGHAVPVLACDSLIPPVPTFIKLDIEGAELDAIEGMRALITETRPIMAVCVYHTPDHLWRIPLRLRELIPDARFYLRCHGAEAWDTVCYAVPPERTL